MTEEKFKEVFWDTLEKSPPHIRDDIREYWASNQTKIQVVVSDVEMDKLEKQRGEKYVAAVTVFSPETKTTTVVFRECMLQAPEQVCRAISAHELYHSFVGPVLAPAAGETSVPFLHKSHVKNLKKKMERTDEFKANKDKFSYEELLVSFGTLCDGHNELKAQDWIRRNGTKPADPKPAE